VHISSLVILISQTKQPKRKKKKEVKLIQPPKICLDVSMNANMHGPIRVVEEGPHQYITLTSDAMESKYTDSDQQDLHCKICTYHRTTNQ
jgi:hypothetical protein